MLITIFNEILIKEINEGVCFFCRSLSVELGYCHLLFLPFNILIFQVFREPKYRNYPPNLINYQMKYSNFQILKTTNNPLTVMNYTAQY